MERRKSESKLTAAADKAAAMLEDLQSRLTQPAEDSADDLDRELQKYFQAPASSSVLDEMRERVIDSVVERILDSWRLPRAERSAIEDEVVERLIERVMASIAERRTADARASR